MVQFRDVVDNSGENTLAEVLTRFMLVNRRSSFATAYFTISGLDLVADKLEKGSGFRLLLGAEPGTDPLRMTIMDIWKNIDIRDSIAQSERAVAFFNRPEVEVRLHKGSFLHGKAYLLNHPIPEFEDAEKSESIESSVEPPLWRNRPTSLRYVGTEGKSGGIAIVGSSNFTYGGLAKNAELNLMDLHGESLVELMTWFEERWRSSIQFKEQLVQVLKGYHRSFPPFWIYAKALYELYREDLDQESAERTSSTIELADFQRAGVKSARRILDRHGGILIADAPGLGKTYIAGKLLEEFAYYQREPALIICPAEVENIWKKFAARFRIPVYEILHTEVLGWGMREGVPRISPSKYKDCSLVLVDESHHFRNPEAGRYAWLQELLAFPKPRVKIEGKMQTRDRKVIFVTATPVNNSVWDLYWQYLLLFGERAPEIAYSLGIPDLAKYFEAAEKGAGNVYDLMERIAVRRSRAFIRENYPNATLDGKPVKFPERKLGVVEYSLGPRFGHLYERAARIIERLHLVPYRLAVYKKGPKDTIAILRGDLLATLFRILLLKRLESSLFAFRVSAQRLVDLFMKSLEVLVGGVVLPAELLKEVGATLSESSEDGINGETPWVSEPDVQAENYAVVEMKRDLTEDLASIRELLDQLPLDEVELAASDTKIKAVVKATVQPGVKLLVFASFVDTASYVFRRLQFRGRKVALVTGEDARVWNGVDEVPASRTEVIERFSPKSNEARVRPEEEIELLVATDVFSEAINLQDASGVLNYDLPWNPMKLVQRAGRIDRMGSLHDTIVVFNAVPEKDLDLLLNLMKKLQEKIAQTHRSVGLEWSLLGEAPNPIDFVSTIERVKARDASVFVDIEKKLEGLVGLDPQEQLLAILQTLSREEIERIPYGAGSLTKLPSSWPGRSSGFFVAYRRRSTNGTVERVWRFYPEKGGTLTSTTSIVSQIQFPKVHPAEDRFGPPTTDLLRHYRTTIEKELQRLEMLKRTRRFAGPIRKAIEIANRVGRADVFNFLTINWKKPAVQRSLRKLDWKDEEKALKELEKLSNKFGEAIAPTAEGQLPRAKSPAIDTELREIAPIPEDHDSSLELVCWMHVLRQSR